jgi:hypothetical protein
MITYIFKVVKNATQVVFDRVLQEPYHYCSVRCKVDAKDVADGDTINVYMDTKNVREAVNVPTSV